MTWLNLDGRQQVDELHRIWQASGALVVGPPKSEPWGLHEFTVADPDGNLMRVFYDFATLERMEGA